MKKLVKWFSIFAVIGTAVGLIVAYFCKSASDAPGNDAENFPEDEDFDLDADLQPTGREYVSLKKEDEYVSLKKEDVASSEDTDEEGSEDTSDDETESADEE